MEDAPLHATRILIAGCAVAVATTLVSSRAEGADVVRLSGYQGIWFDLGQRSEHGSKYSGGLGTYTAKHRPLAIYAEAAQKTFFVYGGTTDPGKRHLLAMVSYYDHKTGQVPRPVMVHDKKGVDDPHDNPSISIDEHGHIWVFISGRGRHRPGFIYRSVRPYDIGGFERMREAELTYPQPNWIDGKGFLHLFTRYTRGRELYWSTSTPDGKSWAEDRKLAGMGGHYQMTEKVGRRVTTAFNMHPGGNVDKRTNLYFVQTDDVGKSWRTVDDKTVETPLMERNCPALVRDYASEGRLVYLKDITADAAGNPILLYITSRHHQPGPKGDPRTWTIAHWSEKAWQFRDVTQSTHNYDMGSLYIESDGTWRIIGPTEAGPQRLGTGGEMAMWTSGDQGRTWEKTRNLTRSSPRNHAYARRPVNARPDFYAFWADGNPDKMSESHLYFTNRKGDKVFQLPYRMETDFAAPVPMILSGP